MFVDRLKNALWLALLAAILVAGGFGTLRALSAASGPVEQHVGPDKGAKSKPGGKPAPAAVRVVSPKKGGIALTGRVTAKVQAYDQVDLLPAVSGTLKS